MVKSHGGADAEDFTFALEQAYHEAKASSIEKIEQGVAVQLAALAEKKIEIEQAAAANID